MAFGSVYFIEGRHKTFAEAGSLQHIGTQNTRCDTHEAYRSRSAHDLQCAKQKKDWQVKLRVNWGTKGGRGKRQKGPTGKLPYIQVYTTVRNILASLCYIRLNWLWHHGSRHFVAPEQWEARFVTSRRCYQKVSCRVCRCSGPETDDYQITFLSR